jgi:hypothetical protein
MNQKLTSFDVPFGFTFFCLLSDRYQPLALAGGYAGSSLKTQKLLLDPSQYHLR